ncbi:IDEAL domain-containing protein [Lysinibacillus sp. A4]|uniref:IDEAL domain-containing protein n=1 Tax=Lysinibacillus sp. A4 TaxID=2976269 RepID=UPI0021759244|nr:IDEAL domain-containing protein [Lysinibacillus sp. A4]MCS5499838.1 IDEAL domain-containing protein [Lysinibacillus sp. A4]
MFNDFFNAFMKAAYTVAIKEGVLVEEDGIVLNPSTIELVKEIEQINLQHLIDNALATGNRELFMQLTNQKEEIS